MSSGVIKNCVIIIVIVYLHDTGYPRYFGITVIEKCPVPDFHLITKEVPRLIIPDPVPACSLIGFLLQVFESKLEKEKQELPKFSPILRARF